MAIQNRRGAYADFDPDKMLSGEFAVVQSGDETTETGKGAYICFEPGDVQRLSTYEEVKTEINDAFSKSDALNERIKTQAESVLEEHPEWVTTISDGAVTTGKLSNGAVTAEKLAANSVTLEKLDPSIMEEIERSATVDDKTVAFTMPTDRTNIETGETLATLFGKIKKWFSELGTAAFRSVSNSLTVSTSGSSVLDAYQGKVLDDKIAAHATKLTEQEAAISSQEEAISTINSGLAKRSPTILFDGSFAPTAVSKTDFTYKTINGLSNWEEIELEAQIGDATITTRRFIKGVSKSYQTVSSFGTPNYYGTADFAVEFDSNRVGVRCKLITGWPVSMCRINRVIGIRKA